MSGPRSSRIRRPRGFLMVEALVSLALLAVLILIAGSLVETVLRFYGKEAPVRGRMVEAALRNLRRDAALATGASPVSGSFSEGALLLTQAGGQVRYSLSAGALVRTESDASGRSSSRVVARSLTRFRFRASPGRALVVQVGSGTPLGRGRRGAGQVVEDAWIALRGGKDGRSW